MVFATQATERMRVHSSGNVSINNTDDTHGLKVTGTGFVTGDFYCGTHVNATNLSLNVGTTWNGSNSLLNSVNIRDRYFNVYDSGVAGYGLAINGYSMVQTNGAHDCIIIGAFTLAQDNHLYALNTFIVTSSEKLKSNIRDIEDTALIHQLSIKRYDKVHPSKEIQIGVTSQPTVLINDLGVIAEEIEALDPDNIFGIVHNKDDTKYVDYNRLFLMGIAEIQKLRKELDDFKKRNIG